MGLIQRERVITGFSLDLSPSPGPATSDPLSTLLSRRDTARRFRSTTASGRGPERGEESPPCVLHPSPTAEGEEAKSSPVNTTKAS